MMLQSAMESPMAMDGDGAVRIGGTRITLDVLAAHFDAGATPEEIAAQFDTLSLADVYLVRAYCLRHPDEVRAHLQERAERAARIRSEIESETGSAEFVAGILGRPNER